MQLRNEGREKTKDRHPLRTEWEILECRSEQGLQEVWARERKEGGWGEEDCGQGSLSAHLWMLQTLEDPTV